MKVLTPSGDVDMGVDVGLDVDDLSNGFHRVRSRLVNSQGVRYYDFRKTLTPRYGWTWGQLLAGHAALVGTVAALLWIRDSPLVSQVLIGLAAAGIIGYTISYIGLFFHAASHYELASDRRMNDLLANACVGTLSGYPMSAYRQTHFNHHRNLGLPEDPEQGYIEALTFRFVIEALTGIRFAKLLLRHLRPSRVEAPAASAAAERAPAESTPTESAPTESVTATKEAAAGAKDLLHWVRLVGLALHASIVLTALYVGSAALAIAWVAGVMIVSPLASAIRLVLEHRSESADPATDYTRVPHGAITRIFGDGPLAQTLGGAGFNRHLLHHWDPQVPFTRLRDLENYLRDTELRDVIKARNTTYVATFRKLFHF